MLANELCLFWIHPAIENCFKQTQCVICFTKIYSVFWNDLTSKKPDTICFLIYCVDLGYIWSLKSDLIRNSVLAILPIFIWFVLIFDQWKIRQYFLDNLLCWLLVHFFIEELFNQTHCVSCFTKILSVFFMNWPLKNQTLCAS